MKVLFSVVCILVVLKWGDAIFTSSDVSVDLTNYLRPGLCPGPRIPTLGLFIGEDGIPRPVPSPYSYKFPGHDQIPPATLAQLLGNLGINDINMDIQSLEPRSELFDTNEEIERVCNLTAVFDNEDGHKHNEIIYMIEQRYREENLTDNSLAIYVSGRQSSFNRTLESIDCRVDIDWFDAGPQIIPRYYASGSCRERRCSLPDRNNFLCRADLTNQNQMTFINALQFHCCWPPTRTRELTCGWRRVRIPIVCDCDCTCGNPEIIRT